MRDDSVVSLEWIVKHVSHFDNIRIKNGQWSLRFWYHEPSPASRPCVFAGNDLSLVIEEALGWLIRERARLGIRGGDP